MLLKAHSGAEVRAVQDILGADIPIIGGYTLGQVTPGKDEAPPDFLNQHITVVVFGEEEREDDTTITIKKSTIREKLEEE